MMKETEKTKMTKSWLDWLEDQNIQLVILDPQDDGEIVKTMRSQSGWDIDADDEEIVVFTRDGESCDFHPGNIAGEDRTHGDWL